MRVFGRRWSKTFGMTAEEVYNRQRILSEIGMFSEEAGSGPGRGVRAEPRSVALLIMSLMCAERRHTLEQRLASYAKLPVLEFGLEESGQPKNLLDMLTRIIGDAEIAARVLSMHCYRDRELFTVIQWGEVEGIHSYAHFGDATCKPTVQPEGISRIEGELLYTMAEELQKSK